MPEKSQKPLLRLDIYEHTVLRTTFGDARPESICELSPADVARAMAGAVKETILLPINTVFYGRRGADHALGILVVSAIRDLHVDGEPAAFHVPCPPLLFAGCGRAYSVFGLCIEGDDEPYWWPDATTRLYHAPFPNVHQTGMICFGSVAYPDCAPETIWQALKLFFESNFNHDIFTGKSRKYPKSILDAYRALAGHGAYPLDDLVETKLTLGDLVRRKEL